MTIETLAADTLKSLIKGIPYAMLTTQGTDGFLHCRPMAVQEDDDEQHLWFFTDITTHKVADIAAHTSVNVSYSDQDTQQFVSISGHVELITDQIEIAARWRPSYSKWIPLAVGDRTLALLKVAIERVSYWKPPAGWIGRSLTRNSESRSHQRSTL